MRRVFVKRSIIHGSLIALLIGLVALPLDRAKAQGDRRLDTIKLLGPSLGIVPRQTVRISVVNFGNADGSLVPPAPVMVRIQLLDSEGEVIAQSDEIRAEPGQTRFWDAPYEQIPGVREPNGRIPLRPVVLTSLLDASVGNRPPLALTMELYDSDTGVTQFVIARVDTNSP